MSPRPVVNYERTKEAIYTCIIINRLRERLEQMKRELIDLYCRKCDATHDRETTGYTSCTGCEINQILNLICEAQG